MKILILTKNNPVEISYVTQRLQTYFFANKRKVYCDSPQVVALEIEKSKKLPYLYTFFPAIKAYRNCQDEISNVVDDFITVGTTDRKDVGWYDIIVGINSEEIQDYVKFDTSIHSCDYFKLKDAEIMFDNIDELITFLRKIIAVGGEYDIQQTTTGSN